jgi:DNA-binding transcriptional regulator YdaS (Cro superfamily)
MNWIEKAIRYFGSQRRMALALNMSPMAVTHWVQGTRVPCEKAILIEQATQGMVHRWEIRPDLWDRPRPSLNGSDQGVLIDPDDPEQLGTFLREYVQEDELDEVLAIVVQRLLEIRPPPE